MVVEVAAPISQRQSDSGGRLGAHACRSRLVAKRFIISVFLERGGTVESALGPPFGGGVRGNRPSAWIARCRPASGADLTAPRRAGQRLGFGCRWALAESGAVLRPAVDAARESPPRARSAGLPVTALLLASRAPDDQILLSAAPAGGLHERWKEGESPVSQPRFGRGPSDVLSRNQRRMTLAEG